MLVHNHFHPQQLRPRSAHSIYSANNNRMMKLTFKKRFTQQLNRLLFPCHPDADHYSSSSSTTTCPATMDTSKTIQEELPDQTDFFENDERAIIVHELSRLPSLKPPPRPAKRSNSNKKSQTQSLESALSSSTLATMRTSHFDDMSEFFVLHGRNNDEDTMSDTTSIDEDDEQDMDDELYRPQVALSVAILPSAVAAATAARSRRYQARVARATQI